MKTVCQAESPPLEGDLRMRSREFHTRGSILGLVESHFGTGSYSELRPHGGETKRCRSCHC